jgi:uncharacterized protein YbjT (DUF2867 family)
MQTVLVAGATGYLGRNIVAHYMAAGWRVRALVRNPEQARASGLSASEIIGAKATRPRTLQGTMDGVDLVISALGITRQRDGLGYRDVDYQANANLLTEAVQAGVPRFAYVHVLNARAMRGAAMVDAKQAFVDTLRAAPIASTVICPSGFFSDMSDFLTMAGAGRVWVFGDGLKRLNPIDGADLAAALATAIRQGRDHADIGGPEVFTQRDLAKLAFAAQGLPARITQLPDWMRRLALSILPWLTPQSVHGPAQMFLMAMGMDMVGEPNGTRRLSDHFAAEVRVTQDTARLAA